MIIKGNPGESQTDLENRLRLAFDKWNSGSDEFAEGCKDLLRACQADPIGMAERFARIGREVINEKK